jgi:hydrogenase maturation protein HypF
MLPPAPVLMSPERRALRVRGGVQGVGFRPFVFVLATRHRLTGLVGNDADGVFIEVEGPADQLDAFTAALRTEAPPLARIVSISAQPVAAQRDPAFLIVESRHDPQQATPVAVDVATCADCLAETRTPGNRRYRYPFTNCTNCGPRYTIVTAVPYDRAHTTMHTFTMCEACAAEYHDPHDRRFHAQPNACPDCGPSVAWTHGAAADSLLRGDAAMRAAVDALRTDAILAVQGVGGFHLVCRADREAPVAELRVRKRRPAKAFAVLVRDLAVARTLAVVSDAEAVLLESPAHPIVLLPRRPEAALAASVAPGQDTVGVMLAYTPLHDMLCDAGPLVCTSGNLADEPIVHTVDDARRRLAPLVDAMLWHDRPIHAPADDSVMRVARGVELPVRRSRGYAPFPVALPHPVTPLLAVGGELKATLCVTRESSAYLSPHIGDVENLQTEQALQRTAAHLLSLFRVTPRAVAADLSPVSRSVSWAARYARESGVPIVRVQHHHAHVAALMAEHQLPLSTRVLGVAWDGTGYGHDGAVWGGEFLLGGYATMTRVAHLSETLLAGGDAAVREPARMALAHLFTAGVAWDERLAPVAALSAETLRVLQQQLTRQLHTVRTTSAGRLLDACAALCGVRQRASYEGQAAMEFESLAATATSEVAYPLPLTQPAHDAAPATLALAPMLEQLVADLARGRDRRDIASAVHCGLAAGIVHAAEWVREAHGVSIVGLTGGVFQNVLLLTRTARDLEARGFRVLTHRAVPPNDGGLALGQALVAASTLQT